MSLEYEHIVTMLTGDGEQCFVRYDGFLLGMIFFDSMINGSYPQRSRMTNAR